MRQRPLHGPLPAHRRQGADVVDEADVRRRYGVAPALVPDLIALRGDLSDGIPGGRGIGDKTAADLLQRHGSLEGAIAGWAGETRACAPPAWAGRRAA